MGSTGFSTPGTPNVVLQGEGSGPGGGGHFEIRGYNRVVVKKNWDAVDACRWCAMAS